MCPGSQMNTHKLELTAKARHLCFLLPLLWMGLVWGVVPGPCRHSVTKDHLLSLSRLIDNQLENGCSIVYVFTERQSLSEVCYVKAAFPQILELLNTHFNYAKNSDNRKYVSTLKRVIYNLYSQRCIPEINEEIEDIPVQFTKVLCSSPKEALKNAKGVIEMYVVLLHQQASPLDWSCQDEYGAQEEEEEEEQPVSTTATDTFTTGIPECKCTCTTFPQVTTLSYPMADSWSTLKQREPNQTTTAQPSSFTHHPYLGKSHADTTMSTGTIAKDTESLLKTAAIANNQLSEKRELSDVPATVFDISYSTEANAVSVTSPVFMDKTDGQAVKDYLMSEHADVTTAMHLADVAQRTFSSIESTAYDLAKSSLDASSFELQHQYDTVGLGHEEILSREYYESKATKEIHRVTPKSTVDNHEHFTMDQTAVMEDRTIKRREKHSKKYRIPRVLRAQAMDFPSTAKSENTRRAPKDRSRTRHMHP